ncbi:disintegrin and metalloproteinase domain-containing protein 7-like [Rhipicephalus microplus]|uniref:disintegrin and metalloproteinase domain-containing protein 7-like n=1 Tax=Rhipicephalus microplus TaxID=6941 RepID=UPI003F6D1EEE
MTDPEIGLQLNELRIVADEHLRGDETYGPNDDPERLDEEDHVWGFEAVTTLNKSTDYINECVTGNCDIVYILLRDELTYMKNGTPSTRAQGIAAMGGVCTENRAAVGEDIPKTYIGVTTMAHEIAHLLGSDHDGCPNATNCSAEWGNLMSYTDHGMVNKSILSVCTMAQIRFLVKRLSDSCIYVNTTANFTNERYPGENVTNEQFCQLLYPNRTVNPSTEDVHTPCELECCWEDSLGFLFEDDDDASFTELEQSSTISYEDYNEDTTEDYGFSNKTEVCSRHYMLDGMKCNATETCFKGICANHSWDDIRRQYRTNRTFPNISEDVQALLSRMYQFTPNNETK